MMSRLPQRSCMVVLMICLTSMPIIMSGNTASARPGYNEQINVGSVRDYVGWYVNDTKVSISFHLVVDAVYTDSVIISLHNDSCCIPDIVSNYIVNISIVHRTDMIGLPEYSGISHTSWARIDIAMMIDANGTRAYNRDNGLLMMADMDVNGTWIFVLSTQSSTIDTTSLQDILIYGVILVAIAMIVLIVYALVIYPRYHRYKEAKREVKIGAKRRNKTQPANPRKK